MTGCSIQSVEYSSGLSAVTSSSFKGQQYLDTVTLASNLVIANQSIGVATSTVGFADTGVDGILGFVKSTLILLDSDALFLVV